MYFKTRSIAYTAMAAVVAAGVAGFAPVPAKQGTYKLDPRHSQIIFEIQHMQLSDFFGRFGKVSGTLVFDPNAPEKSTLDAAVDMSAIDTHVAELDKELVAFFKADKFPSATFKATGITRTAENTGTVTGDLTLAGVTRPVTLNVTFRGARNPPIPLQPYRIGFNGTATIKRSDFDLTHSMWSSFVADDVTLMIEAEGELQ
jgi:polyisoprenoid-binding protein YceI